MAIQMPTDAVLAELGRKAQYHPAELAKLLGWSEWQLRRRFQRLFACSPRDWLNQLRMQDVGRALGNNGTLKEACQRACFHHASSFSRWFKDQKGMTATEFVPVAGDVPNPRPPGAVDSTGKCANASVRA